MNLMTEPPKFWTVVDILTNTPYTGYSDMTPFIPTKYSGSCPSGNHNLGELSQFMISAWQSLYENSRGVFLYNTAMTVAPRANYNPSALVFTDPCKAWVVYQYHNLPSNLAIVEVSWDELLIFSKSTQFLFI